MAWRQHSIPRSGQSQGGVPGANIEARAHEVPGTLHTPYLPSTRRQSVGQTCHALRAARSAN